MKNAWKRMMAFALIFVVIFSNTELVNNNYVIAEQNNTTSANVPIVTSENVSADATEELPAIEISIGNQKIDDYKNIQIKSDEDTPQC